MLVVVSFPILKYRVYKYPESLVWMGFRAAVKRSNRVSSVQLELAGSVRILNMHSFGLFIESYIHRERGEKSRQTMNE